MANFDTESETQNRLRKSINLYRNSPSGFVTTRAMKSLTITICILALSYGFAYSSQGETITTPSQRYGQADATEAPSFRQHIIPLLGVRGCNGRECHGSFAGKGDFQLSLFGYDFEKDHKELVRQEELSLIHI